MEARSRGDDGLVELVALEFIEVATLDHLPSHGQEKSANPRLHMQSRWGRLEARLRH